MNDDTAKICCPPPTHPARKPPHQLFSTSNRTSRTHFATSHLQKHSMFCEFEHVTDLSICCAAPNSPSTSAQWLRVPKTSNPKGGARSKELLAHRKAINLPAAQQTLHSLSKQRKRRPIEGGKSAEGSVANLSSQGWMLRRPRQLHRQFRSFTSRMWPLKVIEANTSAWVLEGG